MCSIICVKLFAADAVVNYPMSNGNGGSLGHRSPQARNSEQEEAPSPTPSLGNDLDDGERWDATQMSPSATGGGGGGGCPRSELSTTPAVAPKYDASVPGDATAAGGGGGDSRGISVVDLAGEGSGSARTASCQGSEEGRGVVGDGREEEGEEEEEEEEASGEETDEEVRDEKAHSIEGDEGDTPREPKVNEKIQGEGSQEERMAEGKNEDQGRGNGQDNNIVQEGAQLMVTERGNNGRQNSGSSSSGASTFSKPPQPPGSLPPAPFVDAHAAEVPSLSGPSAVPCGGVRLEPDDGLGGGDGGEEEEDGDDFTVPPLDFGRRTRSGEGLTSAGVQPVSEQNGAEGEFVWYLCRIQGAFGGGGAVDDGNSAFCTLFFFFSTL